MEKVVLVLAILLSNLAFSQEKLTFTSVIEVDSISKSELYNRAKLWFSESFNSAKSVIEIEDKEAGYIVGKAIINGRSDIIKYTVKIFVREGRYKYEITDFNQSAVDGNSYFSFGILTTAESLPNRKGNANKKWSAHKTKATNEANLLIVSIKTKMNKPSGTNNNDEDW